MSVAASIPPDDPPLEPPLELVFGAGGAGPAPGGIGGCEGASAGTNAVDPVSPFFDEASSSSSEPHATSISTAETTLKSPASAAFAVRREKDITDEANRGREADGSSRRNGTTYVHPYRHMRPVRTARHGGRNGEHTPTGLTSDRARVLDQSTSALVH